MNIATATPIEIDTELAKLHGEHTITTFKLIRNREGARKALRPDTARHYEAEVLKALDEQEAVARKMLPLEAEFIARGTWTRAFVVADGHVHRSMHCSTCNNGLYPTEFGWVTEFSGKTEAEVVEAAGSRACTVCYPNAPVDAPAGRIFHQTEIEAQAARDERAAKKVAADAKKAANAFGPYRTQGKYGDKIETVYAAKQFLTNGAQWGWDHPSYVAEDRDAVATLLGQKLGTTADEQIAAAATRAANR